jgi:branched-chain amino acid transport system substrate-binding protein
MKSQPLRIRLLVVVLLIITLVSSSERNFNNDDTILFGQSCALTGASSALGTQMHLGVLAAFNEINMLGGVFGGKKLKLESYDDYYEPVPARNNTLQLLARDDIFGLIGYVGTPTSVVCNTIVVCVRYINSK